MTCRIQLLDIFDEKSTIMSLLLLLLNLYYVIFKPVMCSIMLITTSIIVQSLRLTSCRKFETDQSSPHCFHIILRVILRTCVRVKFSYHSCVLLFIRDEVV